jgi:hypothetical protein
MDGSVNIKREASMAQSFRLSAIILSAWMFLYDIAWAEQDMSHQQIITDTIKEIRTGATEVRRYEAAIQLAILLRKTNPEEISDKTIADIISLLNIPEARLGVILGLGHLGSRAKAAVPKLLKLLKKKDCSDTDLRLVDTIRDVLPKIGVIPPPPKCNESRLNALPIPTTKTPTD